MTKICSEPRTVLSRGLRSASVWLRWAAFVETIEMFEGRRDDA